MPAKEVFVLILKAKMEIATSRPVLADHVGELTVKQGILH